MPSGAEGGAGGAGGGAGGGKDPGSEESPGASGGEAGTDPSKEFEGLFYVIGARETFRPSDDALCDSEGNELADLGSPQVTVARIHPLTGEIYYLQEQILKRRSLDGQSLSDPEVACPNVTDFAFHPVDGTLRVECGGAQTQYAGGESAPCAVAVDLQGNSP